MKKLFATMLSVVVLTWAGIGCEGNPTGSGDSMPSPSADPAAGDDGGGKDAKPSADKAAKADESGDKKGG